MADCSCISGIDAVDCDDTDTLNTLQSYMTENSCINVCEAHLHGDEMEYHYDGDTEDDFRA